MSYTPNTWQSGDVVTSAKLNNMESGIEAAQFPDVTSADAGKVLAVTTEYSKGAVIVPEQTVVYDGENACELSDVVSDLVEVDLVCICTINGTEYTATIDGDWYLEAPTGCWFDFNENVYTPSEAGTYTVAVYASAKEYGWNPDYPILSGPYSARPSGNITIPAGSRKTVKLTNFDYNGEPLTVNFIPGFVLSEIYINSDVCIIQNIELISYNTELEVTIKNTSGGEITIPYNAIFISFYTFSPLQS